MGDPGVVFFVITILVACYAFQAILAVFNASRGRNGQPPVIRQLFGGLDELTGTWATVGVILVLPVLISWLSTLSDKLLDLDSGRALFEACLATLLVLVTLEFSQLQALNDNNREQWKGLLLFALALDLLSVVILVFPIKIAAYGKAETALSPAAVVYSPVTPEWTGVFSYMLTLGIAALVSSFLIILFTRQAGGVHA